MAWYSKRTRVTGETWEDHARALEAVIEELHEELRQPDEQRLLDQILQDISSGEGQSIEFKTGFAEDDAAIKSLCAFANAKGGTVFFGVKDNGDIVGVDSGIGSNTIENLANKITRNTDPPLTPTIEKVEAQGKIVYYASVPPHRPGELFLAFNTAFIRVGNTNQVMKPDQMRMRLFESANASIEAASTVFLPWLQRSGCPQFDMQRGIQPAKGEIGGDMRISGADPLPNSIEVKWEGAGINMDWTRPSPTGVYRNEQLAFHMGWVTMSSNPDETEVRFSVRFWWDNEQHGATWIWYLVPHASKQRVWEWNPHHGSGTGQPNIEDTW